MPNERTIRCVTTLLQKTIHLTCLCRKREAQQPHFPMDIGTRTFELVAEHLNALDYNGSLGLSCDDTKLFATFHLYWDSKEKAHFLVGGVDGPLRVVDAENVNQAI